MRKLRPSTGPIVVAMAMTLIPVVAAAQDVPYCHQGQEYDAGLCYPYCNSGYDGVGPVCWQMCPPDFTDDGAFCRFDVVIVAKASYGRGVGTVPTQCAAGHENDAGLCYPNCRAGYDGVGPVCWEQCAGGFIDDGAFCRQDAIIVAKDSYGRGVGTIANCDATSFGRPHQTSTISAPFTMIVASDTQLPWGTDPGCTGSARDCEIEFGTRTNRWFSQSMNDIQTLRTWPNTVANSGGRAVETPQGVVINGDLTAFWHPWQVQLYRTFYDPAFSGADEHVLRLPLFPGLGNHDYANNVGDCLGEDPIDWARYGSNACAAQAVRYLRGGIGCGTISNFDRSRLRAGDIDSLAYSWDIGGWHFVQLNNYPTYQLNDPDVYTAIPWLAADLQQATQDGQKIVLNMHDYSEHWSMSDASFQQALAGTHTVAVFAGHFHSQSGLVSTVPGTQIPIFLSGAAETSTFLLVEFAQDYFTVGEVDTTDGTPTWKGTPARVQSYPVPSPPGTNPMTPDAGTSDTGTTPPDSGVVRRDTGPIVWRDSGVHSEPDTGAERPRPDPLQRRPDAGAQQSNEDLNAVPDDTNCACTATKRRTTGGPSVLFLLALVVCLRRRA